MVAGEQEQLFFLTTEKLEARVSELSKELIPARVERILSGALKELSEYHHEMYKGVCRETLIADRVARFFGNHQEPSSLKADRKFSVIGGKTHDLGKIDVYLSTLNKSYSRNFGPWLESDMELMKIHPYMGYNRLMKLSAKSHPLGHGGLRCFFAGSLTDDERTDLIAGAWMALTHHTEQIDSYPVSLLEIPSELVDAGLVETLNRARLNVVLADQYEACYRNNPKYGGALAHDKIKREMLGFHNNPKTHQMIEQLFDEKTGIF